MNLKELNNLICEKISSKEPFSLLRMDNTYGYVSQCKFRNTLPNEGIFNNISLSYEGGVNPGTIEYFYETIYPTIEQTMKDSDILGFVDISLDIEKDIEYTNQYGKKPMYFGHENLMIMDPIGLLRGGYETTQTLNPLWPSLLKNKKVLVISTHVESIKYQYKRIDKIWGNYRDKIAPYELVGVIRSPYHPDIDDRQYPDCIYWHDTVEYIKKEIDKYDYDILLAGCTTSAPIHAEHAKKRGKIGIQTGGVLQLHFGILGYRWAQNPNGYLPWRRYFNPHWIYPMKEDEPRQKFENFESHFAYWKK